MDDATTARLAALRIEYVEVRRELHEAMAEARGRNLRLDALAERAQTLYCEIYEIENDLEA